MQFEFTEQQRMIRDMARDFAQQHIVPGAALETIITRSAVQPGGQVDAAGHLHGVEIEYLEQVIADAQENRALVERNPEWKDVHGRVIGLYNEITGKALENEKAKRPGT